MGPEEGQPVAAHPARRRGERTRATGRGAAGRRAQSSAAESRGVPTGPAHPPDRAEERPAGATPISGVTAAALAIGQAVRIKAGVAAHEGFPEQALSRSGLVDARRASGPYTFVRFRGVMGNILVGTGDLVAVTIPREERAAINSQKGAE